MRKRCLPGKVQQRGAQGDLEHLTMGQPRVAPEGHPQAVVRQLLLGLTQNRQGSHVPGRLSRGFAIPLQQIQRFPDESRGIDVVAVFKRRLECLAERRAGGIKDMEQVALTPRVEYKQSAIGVTPNSALAGIDFQLSFSCGTIVSLSSWRNRSLPPVFRGGSADFPARG